MVSTSLAARPFHPIANVVRVSREMLTYSAISRQIGATVSSAVAMAETIPQLPMAPDAERALLGAILTEPKRFRETDILSADDFLLSSHRIIYRGVAAMDADGIAIEPVLLCEHLRASGNLQTVGGEAYISGLVDGCIPESTKEYVAIVLKTSERRRLLNGLEIAKSRAVDGEEPNHIVASLQEALSERCSGETLGHTYEEILNVPPVSFAIDGFLQEQGITLIGGLSGHGKTLIMLAMVRALLEGGKLFHRFAVNDPAKKVIYLIPECGLSPFAHRLKIFGLADYVREGRLLVRTLSKKPISLNDPRLLREVPGSDVFLDTVTRFKSGDENDAAENAEFAENLFNLQRAGARTITGAHHSPKSFGKDTYMSLENILRGTGDIGAMLATCWGIRQIDSEQNRIYVQNVKPRDFLPCEPFIIQGRPSLDATGYFELTEPPGFAGELSDHVSKEKGGRPAIAEEKVAEAFRLRALGKSYREIGKALSIGKSTVERWLGESKSEEIQ